MKYESWDSFVPDGGLLELPASTWPTRIAASPSKSANHYQKPNMNLPETWELLDERDRLRTEPTTAWSIGQANVIEFMLQLRRGALGDRKLSAGEQQIANAFYTGHLANGQSNNIP